MTYMILHNVLIKRQNTMNKNMQYIILEHCHYFQTYQNVYIQKWYLPQIVIFQKDELPSDFLKYSYK